MTIEKLDLTTPDITDDNVARIAELLLRGKTRMGSLCAIDGWQDWGIWKSHK